MADLSVLIRLHQHELDEKRQALATLYERQTQLEQEQFNLEQSLLREKDAIQASGDVHYTFADFAQDVKRRLDNLAAAQAELAQHIEQAKDSMMETYSELKKFEKAQEKRKKDEEADLAAKETQMLDEIGLETHRRREEGDPAD